MIKGKRVTLKMFETLDEVKHYVSCYNDLSQRSLLDHTEIVSEKKLIDSFMNNNLWGQESGSLQVLVADEFIGTISFKCVNAYELSLGYRLTSDSTNKGYGYEMLSLFIAYLFDSKAIGRLSLYTAENNIPSRKLAEKCGFLQEGVLRKAYFYRGNMHNWVVYGLLREDL